MLSIRSTGRAARSRLGVASQDFATSSSLPSRASSPRNKRSKNGPASNDLDAGSSRVVPAFSREAVAQPDAACLTEQGGDGSLNCHGYGSVVSVTATFGQCAAGWVLDRLAG